VYSLSTVSVLGYCGILEICFVLGGILENREKERKKRKKRGKKKNYVNMFHTTADM